MKSAAHRDVQEIPQYDGQRDRHAESERNDAERSHASATMPRIGYQRTYASYACDKREDIEGIIRWQTEIVAARDATIEPGENAHVREDEEQIADAFDFLHKG